MPRLDAAESRRRFLASPVARLATVTPVGAPHLVPVTFALARLESPAGLETLVTAVDHKPKATTALARLANIAANPAVSLLVDHYAEDWSQLWWVRADGRATVLEPGHDEPVRRAAVAELSERYPRYRDDPPAGPVIVITVARWVGWAWTG